MWRAQKNYRGEAHAAEAWKLNIEVREKTRSLNEQHSPGTHNRRERQSAADVTALHAQNGNRAKEAPRRDSQVAASKAHHMLGSSYRRCCEMPHRD